ncbi:copper homeostasis protein [Bifidobacterium bohemicum]|uniref:PF03932 family protein CutC n=1 Tax=Bifidobacterium bohemicum DSM 22767 TaxID=1437606 RepID=A0A086ZH08_9BIFI|nr:copper homeostasis protein CutC [Bifidobacterium bohemicum]KFI45808.1 copper homeostasis protein [Bifidobacterium bohemicum DSM 22767]SCC10429.1 copper homeostasis protein [Bifidobacterium bohemicum]
MTPEGSGTPAMDDGAFMHRPALEIAVQDLDGARIAAEAGADRVELCAALGATGGITPGAGLIGCCAQAGVPLGVQVLIRPRAGDFVFSDEEKRVQLAEIGPALAAGASGVVVGGVDEEGEIDVPFARDLIDEAHAQAERLGRGVDVTFHRAFDVVSDRRESLETLISLGYTRVLTSGGAPSASEGCDELRRLVGWSAGRIQIMAGGGATPSALPFLVEAGVDAVHLSAKVVTHSAGGPGGGGAEAVVERTDPPTVRAAVAAVRQVRNRNC